MEARLEKTEAIAAHVIVIRNQIDRLTNEIPQYTKMVQLMEERLGALKAELARLEEIARRR